jgi:hypothetical protein
MNSLAFNENIVVSIPGNTRFFIVLLQVSEEKPPAWTTPAGGRGGTTQLAADRSSALPSARELRELMELKTELDRIYRDVAVTRTSDPTGPAQQQ